MGTSNITLGLSEARCYEILRKVRWPDGIVCPHCGRRRVTVHSKAANTPRRRYLCLSCRRTYSDLSGTPVARTNLPLVTWFLCLRFMGGGHSTADLAKRLGVKWESASRMQRRLSRAMVRPGLILQLREAIGFPGHDEDASAKVPHSE